jgi:LAGLIDADG DNA endonuclease family
MHFTLILFRVCLSSAAKAALVISPYTMEVITGMLLGDGHLTKPSTTGQSALQFRLANQDFVQFLWYIFNSVGIVGAEPNTYNYTDKRTGKIYTSYKFSTFSLPILATFYFEWSSIVNGCAIKHLPVNIYELLTPVAIAFWISSDGSYSKRDGIVVISTDNFTLAEVQLLQSILLQKFNIHSTYGTHGKVGQYRIRIRKSSIPLLQSLVAPHMPPMMAYRVGL